jgi:hypothetical protein
VLNRFGVDGIGVVRYDLLFIVPGVERRLKDGRLLVGDLYAFESADQFFRLSAEHGTADHFNTTSALATRIWFDEHVN